MQAAPRRASPGPWAWGAAQLGEKPPVPGWGHLAPVKGSLPVNTSPGHWVSPRDAQARGRHHSRHSLQLQPRLAEGREPGTHMAPPVGKAHSLTSSHLFSLYLQLRVAFFRVLHFLSCTTKSDSNRWNQPNA